MYLGTFPSLDQAAEAEAAFEAGEDVAPRDKPKSKSGERSVRQKGNKWEATGRRQGGKRQYLGTFASLDQAAEAVAAFEED
jgi:hypothetical protein